MRGLLLAAGIVAILAGAANAEAPALQDMYGTACHLAVRDGGPAAIRCGVEHEEGSVAVLPMPLSLPTETEARRTALEKTAAASPAGQNTAARMICGDGRWMSTSDGLEFQLKSCTLRDGGWPQISLLASLGDHLVLGDGLPALLPAMETTAALLANYQSTGGKPPFGGPAAAPGLLEVLYGGPPPVVTSASFGRYAKLVETARLQESHRDYHAAEDSYRQALLILEQSFGKEAPALGGTLINLALEVSNQGRFTESAALLHRADPIVARSPNPADQARLFTYSALDAANAGRFTAALSFAREAATVWRSLAETEGPTVEALSREGNSRSVLRGELAHSINLAAAMALRTHETAYAETSAREALAILGEEHDLPPWWKAEALVTFGEIMAQESRLDKAEECFRGALIIDQRLFGDTAPTAVTLMLLGKVYAEQQLDDEALRAYGRALDIWAADRTAGTVTVNQIAPLLIAGSRAAATQPSRRGKIEQDLFRAVQLTGHGAADDAIAKMAGRLAGETPEIATLVRDLQDAERGRDAARLDLAHRTMLPDDERSALEENALFAEITRRTQESERLAQQVTAKYPAYAHLIRPASADLAGVQRQLAPGEALVQFLIGRDNSFILVVRNERLAIRPLPVDLVAVEQAVGDLRKPLRRSADGRIGTFDVTAAQALYRGLFGPVEGDLDGIRHLIVVPDGALSSLPLSLLVAGNSDQPEYRHADWLIRHYAISVVPSVRAFALLRQTRPANRAGHRFLGIGAPAFGNAPSGGAMDALATACREDGPVPAHYIRALPPLPDAAAELRAVAHSVGAGPDSLLLGGAASEPSLRRQNLETVAILYFATHGLLPGELLCQTEPGLALSPPVKPATAREDDGLLEASEIAALHLNADLVVLSACNTAVTERKFGGDSLSGLAEAFFQAGARNVVASHWQVPSEATAAMMSTLFARMGPTLSADVADSLRQAQLAMIDGRETSHPYFWAAFSVFGDGGQRRPDRGTMH